MLEEKTAPETEEETPAGNTEKVIPFDLAMQYQDPDNPENVISGDTLKNIINRGKLSDQLKSDRDKMRNQNLELAQRTEQLLNELNQAKAQIQAITTEKTVEQKFQELMKPAPRPTQTESSWLTGDEEPETPQPQVDPEKLQAFLNNMKTELTGQIDNTIKQSTQQRIDEILQERNITEQNQKQVESFIAAATNARKATLSSRMPNLSEASPKAIEDIVANESAADALSVEARQALSNGDNESFREYWIQSEAFKSNAADLRDQAAAKERQLAAADVQQRTIEDYSTGNVFPKEVVEQARKPTYNVQEAEKKKKNLLQLAIEKGAAAAKVISG